MNQESLQKSLENAKTLKELAALIESLSEHERSLKIDGAWSIGMVFSHCAQSIQYSIIGYPEMKPALFRGTIGSLAFSMFSMRGKMSHGLEEPIPGSGTLSSAISFDVGKKELLTAISLFSSANESSLKPHFAYGTLDKVDYDMAHTLHIKNHFERLVFQN
jgi:hypothetical protein